MDALGSLRGVVNPTGEVLEGQHYAPYGTLFGHTGTAQTAFGFTGEITDPNGLLNLRARYYVPWVGVFPNLDPVEEGNRYGYVGGDVVNRVDPSGMVGERPERWDGCQQQGTICPPGWDQWNFPYTHICSRSKVGIQGKNPRESANIPLKADDAWFVASLEDYADALYLCLDAQNCNSPLLSRQPTDVVDALALLVEFAHAQSPLRRSQGLTNAISIVLLGTYGTDTILRASYNGNRAHPLRELSSGIHSDFHQATGQPFHFWAYLNTEAQGSIYSFSGDFVHECLGDFQGTGTVEDARLTTLAYRIGGEVRRGNLSPLALAGQIRSGLRTAFTGCLAPWYYSLPCKALRETDKAQRGQYALNC